MTTSDVYFGRAGNRTQDLSHTEEYAKRTLYQLSHTPEVIVVEDKGGSVFVRTDLRQGLNPNIVWWARVEQFLRCGSENLHGSSMAPWIGNLGRSGLVEN